MTSQQEKSLKSVNFWIALSTVYQNINVENLINLTMEQVDLLMSVPGKNRRHNLQNILIILLLCQGHVIFVLARVKLVSFERKLVK